MHFSVSNVGEPSEHLRINRPFSLSDSMRFLAAGEDQKRGVSPMAFSTIANIGKWRHKTKDKVGVNTKKAFARVCMLSI